MISRRWMASLLFVSSMCVAAQAQAQAQAQGRARARSSAEAAPGPKPVISESTPKAQGFALRGVGLRGSLGRLERADPVGAGDLELWNGGGDLYERGVGVLRLDQWSGRYFDELWIGYGSEGLRYQLYGQLGFGGMWLFGETPGPRVDGSPGGDGPVGDRPVVEAHGILARFAMRGELRREADVFSSEVRLPGGELGYSWSRGSRQLEILGHAGWTLTGRFNPEGQTRDLRGMSYGSSLSVGWDRLRLDADVSWVAAHDDLGALLHGRAHFCGLSQDRWGGRKTKRERMRDIGRPPPPPGWAVCADFRVLQGRTDVRADAATEAIEPTFTTQYVGGLSIVIGQVGHL